MGKKLMSILTLGFFLSLIGHQLSAAELNDTVKSDEAIESNRSSENYVLSAKDIFTNDTFQFQMSFYQEDLEYTNTTKNYGNYSLESSIAREMRMNWLLTSGLRWQPIVTLGLRTMDYDLKEGQGVTHTSDHFWSMGAGIRHRLSQRWEAVLMGQINQYPFLEYTDSTTGAQKSLTIVALTQISLLANVQIWQNNHWELEGSGGFNINPDKSKANFKAKKAIGFQGEVALSYWFTKPWAIKTSLWAKTLSQKVRNLYFEADAKRTDSGLTLQVAKTF